MLRFLRWSPWSLYLCSAKCTQGGGGALSASPRRSEGAQGARGGNATEGCDGDGRGCRAREASYVYVQRCRCRCRDICRIMCVCVCMCMYTDINLYIDRDIDIYVSMCNRNKCGCRRTTFDFGYNNRRCRECGHPPMRHYSYFNRCVLTPIQRYGYRGLGRVAYRTLRSQVLGKGVLRYMFYTCICTYILHAYNIYLYMCTHVYRFWARACCGGQRPSGRRSWPCRTSVCW